VDRAVLLALATYRTTKLVIDDEITRELRNYLYEQVQKLPPKTAAKLEYLLGCPWCISIWAGSGLALLVKLLPDVGEVVVNALAASAAAGLLFER